MNKITVGQIIKAFGIKGEVKVKPLTDDVTRFEKLRTVYIKDVQYKIFACRINDGFAYLKFVGVSDRNASELLVGNDLLIDREDAVDLPEGRYFISDIIGCEVYTDAGDYVGKIKDILQYGAADVFVVENKQKPCSFPFVEKLEADVDVENKKIVVNAKALSEVCVYED